MVANKSIPVKESELEDILKRIAELATKINVVEIENETKDSKKNSQELIDKIDATSLKIPDLFAEINKTAELYQAENSKLEKSELESNEFASSNQKVEEDLKEVNVYKFYADNLFFKYIFQLKEQVQY
jgi:hypothetical protein